MLDCLLDNSITNLIDAQQKLDAEPNCKIFIEPSFYIIQNLDLKS